MKFAAVVIGILVMFGGVLVFSGKSQPAASNMKPAASFSTLAGKPAPDFTLSSYDGKLYTLSQLKGKKVVLFFNEGIMCYPACWNQIAAFGTDARFNNDKVVTLNVVPDQQDEWVQAVHKMPELSKATILLDTSTAVSANYNVLNLASSMHKGMKPGHTYVIVDSKGVVRYTKDDVNMGVNNDVLAQELAKAQ